MRRRSAVVGIKRNGEDSERRGRSQTESETVSRREPERGHAVLSKALVDRDGEAGREAASEVLDNSKEMEKAEIQKGNWCILVCRPEVIECSVCLKCPRRATWQFECR